MHRLFLALLLFILTAGPAWATSFYVSPSGSGTACTSASPCLMSTALERVRAGDTIWMKDGNYTGSGGMLTAPANLSGTASARITVKAVNDGAVLVDGQGKLPTCQLIENNDYWTIEGINFANSSLAVISISNGSDNNIFKRVIAWNASPDLNKHIISTSNNSTNVLYEDCAWFGSGRKGFEAFSGSDYVTVRRGWGRFEYSARTDPKMSLTPYYDNYHMTIENCILTWDQQPGTNTSQTFGILAGDWIRGTLDRRLYLKILGTIVYLPPDKTFSPSNFVQLVKLDEIKVKDLVVFIPSDHPLVKPAWLGNCMTSHDSGVECSSHNLTLTNASLIGGAKSNIGDHWILANVKTGANVSSVYGTENLFLNSGNKGATVCKQYVDGNLTTTPIWPWPMNQRIIDAMRASGRTPVDVTATMEELFGRIPNECKNPAQISNTPPPNLRITSSQQ
jgi:hypothetical protein